MVEKIKRNGRTWLVCRCDCGEITRAQASHLRRGEVVSCGCWRATAAALRESPATGLVVTETDVHFRGREVAA